MRSVPALLHAALALALSSCSRDDAGPDTSPMVRLADDAWIESVESPLLDVVRGDVPLERTRPAILDQRGFEDWSWFLVANAFGDGPLVAPPVRASIDLLDRVERGVLVPSGLGVAACVEVGRRAPLELELTGDFDREDGLAVLVAALDVPPPSLAELVEPGRLRALHRDHVVGSVHAPTPTDDPRTVRLRLRPVAAARSVLVLVSMHGGGEARLERLTGRWLSPFEALVGEGRISDRFVAAAEVDGEVRPAIALTPGTTVTTRPLAPPAGARLLAHVGGVLGPRPETATLRVELLGEGGRVLDAIERPVATDRLRWAPFELDAARLARGVERLRFSFRAEGADDGVPLLFVGAPRIVSPPTPAPLDLLLVSLDTVRADRLGAYGGRPGLTPHLDRLAEEGTMFERAYASAPYTLPSHVTMFTGLPPDAHGVETALDRVPSAAPWLPRELAEAGYDTAAYTSGGYVGRAFGFGPGFDVYCEVDPIGDRYFPGHAIHNRPFPDGSTGALPRALEWLRTREGRPAFLFLHTYMAHDYLPPPELAREFGLLDEGEPPLTYAATERFDAQRVAREGLGPEDRRRLVHAYDATVKACDAMVGEVLAALEAAGTADRTIVVVTSDHGEELLDHGGTGHGITLYEEVVRVPLIVRVPGRGAGRRVAARVSLVDLAPTLLELLGRTPPAAMEGRSFAAAFDGATLEDRPIVCRVDDPPRSVREAVIANGWKLHRATDDPSLVIRPRAEVELFHLPTDPAERDDRHGREPRIAASLEERLDHFLTAARTHREALEAASAGEGGEVELSPEMEERLRALGYLGGE